MELRDTFSDKNNIDGLINIFQKAILVILLKNLRANILSI